jgi:hypothetical protein
MDTPELPDAANDPLNRRISIIVALSATFLSICNIKDGNIVQAMQQAQADGVDTWSYFQAKSTKEHVGLAAVAELTAIEAGMPEGEAKRTVDALLATWKADAARYEKDKHEVEAKARGFEARYNALNLRDDQFDMAEATLSLAIALMGITALTRQKWLLGVGSSFAAFGCFMGVAGFAEWPFHPNALAAFLS